jgi:hypothetical protein
VANKITVLLDLITDRAQQSVKGFRQSVADAEGATGKFRAGASSAMASVQANAGTLALAGGSALAAFGAKAIGTFQETALEAGKLADATGLTVEAASRLREVASDVGVSGETVTSVVKKMTVEIGKGNPLLEEYGIALQHGADGAADINATLVDTIRKIGAIEDPTKRAAAAQAAFGRGYTEAAELILGSADELERKLADVSDAKIITDEELANAREFRDTMEQLKDVGEDLATSTGSALVPSLGALAEALLFAQDAAKDLNGILGDLPGDFSLGGINRGELGALGLFARAAGEVRDRLSDPPGDAGVFQQVIDNLVASATAGTDAVDVLGNEVTELGPRWAASTVPLEAASGAMAEMGVEAQDLGDDVRDVADDFNVFEDGLRKAADTVDFLTSELTKLDEDLGELDALNRIEEQFARIADTDDLEDQQTEIRQLIGLVGDYVGELEDIPASRVTEIISVLRSGDVDRIRTLMDELTKDRFINVTVNPPQQAFRDANAVFAPGAAPSAPTFSQPAIPNYDMSTTIINYPVGTTPTTVNQDQQTYQRWNGPR